MPRMDKNYKSEMPVAKNRHTFNYQVARSNTIAKYWLAFAAAIAFIGAIIVGIL